MLHWQFGKNKFIIFIDIDNDHNDYDDNDDDNEKCHQLSQGENRE